MRGSLQTRECLARCIFVHKNVFSPPWGRTAAELAAFGTLTCEAMPRNKEKDRRRLLSHPIRTRVTEEVFNRLEKIRVQSNCQSIGEVARKILSREKILVLHRDASLSGPMEELASIRRELRAIGVNINQLTRKHHGSATQTQKDFYRRKAEEQQLLVEGKVDRLLEIVSQLADRWLQES